jgi:hypothetical protein
MGAWGRILVENEWSMVTALQRLHGALGGVGLGDKIGLARKISVRPVTPSLPPVRFVRPEWPAWRALGGFGPWEGPYPQWKLPRVRTAHGPAGRVEIHAEEDGRHRVLIRCFNSNPEQRVAMSHDGVPCGETTVPVTHGGVAYVARFEADLRRGPNVLELRYWRFGEHGSKTRAMLVADVTCGKVK